MIDLHCHLLPGIDDGAKSLDDALAMARMAVDDGIQVTACTPHIYPGLYENSTESIVGALEALRGALAEAAIPLRLVAGADAHLTPVLLTRLQDGSAPTLGDTRYFLLEPAHHVAPRGFSAQVASYLAGGFVPVITHPERLTWIDQHYDDFVQAARHGAWLQVTSGSLTGDFGSDAQYWAEKLVDEGWVHIVATDAHGIRARRPELAKGARAAAKLVGTEEAQLMVDVRPRAILGDTPPNQVVPPPALREGGKAKRSFWSRLL
ncbi:MAG: CpsB/CapC family capsule biosynthesis tyrosine phosphatase [Burkholderiales bacterium]